MAASSMRERVREVVARASADIHFAFNRKRLLAPPGAPLLDAPTRAALERLLETAKTYVEFGAGGATLLAARKAELVVSVESDAHYGRLVEAAIASERAQARVAILHGRIGPTGEWGAPLFRTRALSASGAPYVNAAWKRLDVENRDADLVLVDGRYRIACVLSGLLHPRAANAIYIVDDFQRPTYHPALDFVDVLERPGRSLVARRRTGFDAEGASRLLERALYDWR